MSDALDYLMKIRPEAMNAYFGFLKQSGAHLDKKTRALISVITKVDKQTTAGFRQYLLRALQAGATADEIIDALFVAFPSLGLSKIVWAIDIIIGMEIPEFSPEKLGAVAEWHHLGDMDTIPQGTSFHHLDNRELIIFRQDEEIKVYDNHCPHQATKITPESLENGLITCPGHHWKFDITTGACIDKGNRPLNSYRTRMDNNCLSVFW